MAGTGHGDSTKAILYAFLANLGLAIAKTGAALYTGSGSMMAEAIHSFSDCGNQILLFIGLKQAEKPADVKHPLGYGKVTYFWSFIVAIMLFSMGGLYSVYEGWHKLHEPGELNQLWIALLVLGLGIVLESSALYGALKVVKTIRQEKTFFEWFKVTRNAELVVILGEDSAATLGLIIAFIFVSTAAVTGNPMYDALGSICIGIILLCISVFIGWRIKSLIVGRSAEPELRELIDKIINKDDSIEKLLNSVTMQFGAEVLLAAKLKMKAGLSIEEAVTQLNELEVEIKKQVPSVKWCFMEPDIKD
ncbi:MAG: cation diffusion facilitator family transporter [Proteobacteria bacterium]|nr:cation diffusion facilitator family transporter [Pseudomonadota bacterium]NOG60162.1 cation diffusion facilitator family transporter [Pseudomonadota bacterium]